MITRYSIVLTACLLCLPAVSFASPCDAACDQPEAKVVREFPLGVRKYQFDYKNAVTGWHLRDGWYFGRQRGDVKNFGFIRRGKRTQLGIGKEGVTFSVRF